MGKVKDLTGMRFGKLTVVKRDGTRESGKDKRATWWCRCDCGNPELISVTSNCLVMGRVKSCGCLKSDCQKKYNIYDLSGNYGIGYSININEYGENKFYFDLEDYDKIKNYTWKFDKSNYLQAWGGSNSKTYYIKLHRLIMGIADPKIKVDHIHGSLTRNDNRKSNLRLASSMESSRNHKIHCDNTSGCSGVQWHNKTQMWEVWITINYKKKYLGNYHNKEDAIECRKKAEEKYFGEWSYDNSQAIPYEIDESSNDEKGA